MASHHAFLLQADDPLSGDDEVIQDADVHQGQRGLQCAGELDVRLRRLGAAAGMVVNEDHRRCLSGQCFNDHLSRVDGCLAQMKTPLR